MKNERTLVLKRNRTLEKENETLGKEVERLKQTSAVHFGKGEERVNTRIERIVSVTEFEENIIGRIQLTNYDMAEGIYNYSNVQLLGYLRKFCLHIRKDAHGSAADLMFIGKFEGIVDYEKELADIRVLLAETSKHGLPCSFVIGTNEDLSAHRKKLIRHFAVIKSVLDPKDRRKYVLEIWDAERLLELEYEHKIKVRPLVIDKGAKSFRKKAKM